MSLRDRAGRALLWEVASRVGWVLIASGLLLAAARLGAAEDRRARVLSDRTDVADAGKWIYDDLAQARAQAAKSGKPLLVVLRCIP